MTKILRFLILLTSLALAAACGGRSGESQCVRYCRYVCVILEDNFAEPPDSLQCADPKWNVDCDTCNDLIRQAGFDIDDKWPRARCDSM